MKLAGEIWEWVQRYNAENSVRIKRIIARNYPDHVKHEQTEGEPKIDCGLLVHLPLTCSCGDELIAYRDDFCD